MLGGIVPLDKFLRSVCGGRASDGVRRRSYNKILFSRVVSHGPNFRESRNFCKDSNGAAVPTQNDSLTRDIPSVGMLVGLLLVLC